MFRRILDQYTKGNQGLVHAMRVYVLIKSAILMPTAKTDEVTVVQIESEGYNKQKVIVPICAMKGGSDFQQYVDLLVPCPAKLKLLQGEGPINLVGSHCVDFYGYRDVGAGDSEDEEDDATDNDAEMETEDAVKEKGDEKAGKKKTPIKENKDKGDEKAGKKKTPIKENKDKVDEKAGKKKTPAKEDSGSKKRKGSSEQTKSAEKKK